MTEKQPSKRRFALRRSMSSVSLAAFIAAAAIVWVVSGQFGAANTANTPAGNGEPQAAAKKAPVTAQVRVRVQSAEQRERRIVIRGRTAASRTVDLRAETMGRIVEIVAERGARLNAADVILRIAEDDRPARLKEAQARLRQRQVDYKAARKLNKKGFSPETRLAETRADLEAARAKLARIELDIEHTEIRAPFDGVLQTRPVEIGDFVDVGDKVAMLVDLDPVIVVGHVTERDIGKLRVGGPGRARLVTGEEFDGHIRYISAMSDDHTRTFRVELEVPNPEGRVVDGVTADISLPVGAVLAHRIPPAILTLADDGAVGLKIVNEADIVEFRQARIVDETAEDLWLAGLPETVRIITVGQEFVRDGQKVLAREEGAGAGS